MWRVFLFSRLFSDPSPGIDLWYNTVKDDLDVGKALLSHWPQDSAGRRDYRQNIARGPFPFDDFPVPGPCQAGPYFITTGGSPYEFPGSCPRADQRD